MTSSKTVALLGAPIDLGAGQRGTQMGPAALRTAGIERALADLGFDVADHGDLAIGRMPPATRATPENARNYAAIQAWTETLSAHAYNLAASGAVPVFLGGDHSLSMGSINGVARHWRGQNRALFVLWLDAHADFNTPATTPSGNMHGMSAAFLCGEPGLEELLGAEPRVSIAPERLELFGIRSVDAMEKRSLRARGISIVDMRAIDEFGVGVLIRRIIDKVKAANGVLHVSLDVDFLDPAIAPAVGTTVPGGATFREAHLVMELLHDSGLVRSLDIVELNPFLDERGRTALVLVDLVSSLFGRQIIERPTTTGGVIPPLEN